MRRNCLYQLLDAVEKRKTFDERELAAERQKSSLFRPRKLHTDNLLRNLASQDLNSLAP